VRFVTIAICALGTAFATFSAQANTLTFTLNQDGCTGTCGSAPFGTISLTDNGSGSSAFVTVTETLAASERYAGGGAGEALEFNVTNPVVIGNITPNFAVGPAPASASTFGSFLLSITCSTCQGGQAGNPAGPLSFTVSSATGVTVQDFGSNVGGYFFASDIVGNNGNTGNVATNAADPSVVPEPGTVILTLSGLLLVALTRSAARLRAR
jgi:hypothetical protein